MSMSSVVEIFDDKAGELVDVDAWLEHLSSGFRGPKDRSGTSRPAILPSRTS